MNWSFAAELSVPFANNVQLERLFYGDWDIDGTYTMVLLKGMRS